ncbi:hypothetical protein OG21DRAFT_1517765 [Imleria badia]|nr:hypothetical protein OG21DRAFT_1517765 [Imleria badia]
MSDNTTLRVTQLGAGQEVGRSCVVVQYRDKSVVCDTGIHPGRSGMAALPFVDHLDWSTVDAILITQWVILFWLFCYLTVSSFHLDHAAALTYILKKVEKALCRMTCRLTDH